jgi:molybdenum cofactor cytidylyltransferase
MIGAVVLAAGKSSRMGRPKMVLPWGNTTVIGQVANTLISAGVGDVSVVTGGARLEVANALKALPIRIVFNPDFNNNQMMLTLQIGLAALGDSVEAALVVLGDQPQLEVRVVRKVIATYHEQKPPLIIPSYQMRRGHPWLLARPCWKTLLELEPTVTMRKFLNENAADITYVNVDSPSILQDLDTPEDYKRYRSSDFK